MNGEINSITRLQMPLLIVGALAVAGAAIAAFLSHQQSIFFRGYLVGFLFCAGIAIGSLALLMIQYLTGGGWGWSSADRSKHRRAPFPSSP